MKKRFPASAIKEQSEKVPKIKLPAWVKRKHKKGEASVTPLEAGQTTIRDLLAPSSIRSAAQGLHRG